MSLHQHFHTCMDWILGRATIQSHCGVALGSIKVTDLDFADDVILSGSLESLVVAFDAFSNDAKPLGLEFSWTKIQDLVQSVCACSKDIKVTESFTYLRLSDQEVSQILPAGICAEGPSYVSSRP